MVSDSNILLDPHLLYNFEDAGRPHDKFHQVGCQSPFLESDLREKSIEDKAISQQDSS